MTAKEKKKPSELEKLKERVDLLEAYVMTANVPEKNSIAAKLRELRE